MAQTAQRSTYLRPQQIQEMENEKRVMENTLKQRDVQDRGRLVQQIAKVEKQIESQAPPDLTPEQRDQVIRENRMIEDRLVPMMPSDEEMRRNPPGTVGRHMRFDKVAKATDRFPEGELRRWKNNQLALNKGDFDPDVANFERLRPLTRGASMLNAQIPGKLFVGTNPTEAYREGYDRTFGGKQEVEAQPEEEPAEVAALDPKMARALCGKEVKVNGKFLHELRCKKCGELRGE